MPPNTIANGFEERRERLLDVLTTLDKGRGSFNRDSNVNDAHYSNRVRWQYYMGCLARGIKVEEANAYFASSDDIQPEEWQTLCYLRTYLQFKDTALNRAASDRLLNTLRAYKDAKMDGPACRTPECHGTRGNHSIVAFSFYLLADQALGNGPKHGLAREKFIDWAQYHGRYGRDEVNSPHYLDRSFLPLLNLYDYSADPEIRLWAQMCLDKMVTDFALLGLKNVRGGPWCRAHQNHAPFCREQNDGTHNTFYVAGYQLFGGSAVPPYVWTDQILNYAFMVTTRYRAPAVAARIADAGTRGPYEVKSGRKANARPRNEDDEWDMYYYMTPAFCLASLQDRIPLDNHLTNATTTPRDYVNTQTWELTFSDPMKKLGPKRDLGVLTGGYENIHEDANPNTANMQYRNVLFFKGWFMDYNDNLHAGGEYARDRVGEKALHFWRIATREGQVYLGVTNFPKAEAGILEVGLADDYPGFQAFRDAVKNAPASCEDSGKKTRYTSTRGDEIVYVNASGNPGDGSATVNGKDFPLHGYAHYESPWLNAARESGALTAAKDGASLRLDFRDRAHPVREEHA
ncbi:MAG: hypothetical protein JXR37_26645 [Kiritimatiellae bacterium]|nr:hypothetical protein [Kiritimatiellia bacterium]